MEEREVQKSYVNVMLLVENSQLSYFGRRPSRNIKYSKQILKIGATKKSAEDDNNVCIGRNY